MRIIFISTFVFFVYLFCGCSSEERFEISNEQLQIDITFPSNKYDRVNKEKAYIKKNKDSDAVLPPKSGVDNKTHKR